MLCAVFASSVYYYWNEVISIEYCYPGAYISSFLESLIVAINLVTSATKMRRQNLSNIWDNEKENVKCAS